VAASIEGSQGSSKKYALMANLPQALASNVDLLRERRRGEQSLEI